MENIACFLWGMCIMKIVEKRGARTGGLRVSRSFNPEPDLDNANVGR